MFVYLTAKQFAQMPCSRIKSDLESINKAEFLIGFFTETDNGSYFFVVDGANTFYDASRIVNYLNGGGTHKTVTVEEDEDVENRKL